MEKERRKREEAKEKRKREGLKQIGRWRKSGTEKLVTTEQERRSRTKEAGNVKRETTKREYARNIKQGRRAIQNAENDTVQKTREEE